MPCERIGAGFMCLGGPFYEYGGWLFEVHTYSGPWPLDKRDRSTPRRHVPPKFWDMWKEFKLLSAAEMKGYEVKL